MGSASGIYQIRNILNGKRYIGSAVSFTRRWAEHKRELHDGTHHSAYLQNAWDKHGAFNFVFEELLRLADCNQLISIEQIYLDCHKPEYNMNSVAGKPPQASFDVLSKRSVALWESGALDGTLRPVERIDPTSGEIKEYKSISAVKDDGFSADCVWRCANGLMQTHLNFYWKYSGAEEEILKKNFRTERIFRPVIGVRDDGASIILSSRKQCKELGFNYNAIRGCCAGIRGRRTHGGYIWRYEDANFQEVAVASAHPTFEKVKRKSVIGTDINTGQERRYDYVNLTAEDGFTPQSVSQCANGLRRSHKGYAWRFEASDG